MYLLVVLVFLVFIDSFKINGIIGYKKVKEYLSYDINIFSLAKGFFGKKILNFYNSESTVNSTIYNIEKYGEGFIIYQYDECLYSLYIGCVSKVEKNGEYYSVVIDTSNKRILINNLISLEVSLYDKIEVETIIGIVDGWYYYEEI